MASTTVDEIKVRMYRHGFGDCFLLQHLHAGKCVFTMVIDCGIKLNTKSAEVPIADVMADLHAVLPKMGGKPRIDVLAVTHEHWDHVAFFHPDAKDCDWTAFDIGQVWMAWTEDPDDDEAVQINSRLRDAAGALHVAAARLAEIEDTEKARVAGLNNGAAMAGARGAFTAGVGEVLSFHGAAVAKPKAAAKPARGKPVSESGIKYKPNGKISVATEEAMTYLVDTLGKPGGVEYLEPGTLVKDKLVPAGVRVYVLGPPRNSLINQSNPTGGGHKETYLGIDGTGLAGFIDGVMQFDAKDRKDITDRTAPFGPDAGLIPEQFNVQQKNFFDDYYFVGNDRDKDRDRVQHRRIDNAWLDAAGQFALQLDGAVNNTSLVLAIEIETSGSVLLFPGDAQVGSWLSWHQHTWKVKRDGKTVDVTATDLLNATVLYKVSHHGSHNATVAAKGLELMTSPELVAFIPEKENSYSGILYGDLIDRLEVLCKGRVVVSADSQKDPEKLRNGPRPAAASAKAWKAFTDNLTVEDAYVEYAVR